MQALADFAGGMTLDPKEIDKERGVVIEEWRGGLGAGSRLRDQQIPVLYYQSKYAERLPIGKPEILKSLHAGTAARLLHEVVSARPHGGGRRRRHRSGEDGSARSGTEFGAHREARGGRAGAQLPGAAARRRCWSRWRRDPEATQSSVSLVASGRGRAAGTRRATTAAAWSTSSCIQMLNERFDEMSRKPDAPFLSAGAYGERADARRCRPFALGASVQDGKIERGPGGARDRGQARRASTVSAPASSIARRSGCSPATTAPTPSATRPRAARYVAGVRQSLPRERAEPGHRLRAQAGAGADPGDHRRRRQRRGQAAVRDTEPRRSSAVSPQKPDLAVPTEAELAAAVAGAEAVAVTAWNDTASDARR